MSDWTTDRWREKYYDKVEELNRIESAVTGGMAIALERIKRLEAGMKEIKKYSADPFNGDKWRNYINELATEVLK